MRTTRPRLLLWVSLLLLVPSVAQAQYFAKINEIHIDSDGATEVLVSVLDRYGEPPPLSAYENIKVYFGEANEFELSGDEIQAYADSGKGTDYVIILPAYEGFGVNNAIAAAEGAGAFQMANVGENDSCMIFTYGDGVLPFDGNAAELAAGYGEEGAISRVARPYMLSAIAEAVRYYDDQPPGRRRIVILVGTGMDVELSDATRVDLNDAETAGDIDRARRRVLRAHQETLRRYIQEVEQANARIYAIGYNDHRSDYLEVLKALSRKTGGTYRRVTNIGDLATTGGTSGVFTYLGDEIANELILRPGFEVENEREYEIWATFRMPERTQVLQDIRTRIYFLTVPPDTVSETGAIIWVLVVVGVILIVVFLLLVVLFFLTRRLKRDRTALAEKQALEDKVAAAEIFCSTCHRKMMPDWENCMFCQSGMAPLEEKPTEVLEAEEAQEKLDEITGGPAVPREAMVAGSAAAIAFYASHHGKPTCTTCGRVIDPLWSECMFCQAGMPPLEDLPPQPEMPIGDVAVPMAGKGMAAKKPDE